jgi:hypothetical protein
MRGVYRNELLVGASSSSVPSVPGEDTPIRWGKWVTIGAVAIGGYLLVRAAAKVMKSQDAHNAFWDAYATKHGYSPDLYRK